MVTGEGTLTPITPGAPTAAPVAEPLPYSLLSLPGYAKILGIAPVHFAGAAAGDIFPGGTCNDIWPRYSWQKSDAVSHWDLAFTMRQVEQEIARVLGWWPAPVWMAQELRLYPRHHRPDVWRTTGLNVRGAGLSVRTEYAKLIGAGRRAVTLLGTATTVGGSLAYSDNDGDSFAETATVTMPTTLTDETQIKVYISNTGGAQDWEIREPRTKTISGGVFTAVFDSWLFIDPDVMTRYPTTERFVAIDISTTANYVTAVDVYREYTDHTEVSCELMWEPTPRLAVGVSGFCTACQGAGCEACLTVVQDGCLQVRDPNRGLVVPIAATYSDDNEQWEPQVYTECRNPDMVKLWYYCGDLSQPYLRGSYYGALSTKWARAIAAMTTARLERPFCSCGNTLALAQMWRRDLAAISSEARGSQSYQVTQRDLSNPFGTRSGEIIAWKLASKARGRVTGGGSIPA